MSSDIKKPNSETEENSTKQNQDSDHPESKTTFRKILNWFFPEYESKGLHTEIFVKVLFLLVFPLSYDLAGAT